MTSPFLLTEHLVGSWLGIMILEAGCNGISENILKAGWVSKNAVDLFSSAFSSFYSGISLDYDSLELWIDLAMLSADWDKGLSLFTFLFLVSLEVLDEGGFFSGIVMSFLLLSFGKGFLTEGTRVTPEETFFLWKILLLTSALDPFFEEADVGKKDVEDFEEGDLTDFMSTDFWRRVLSRCLEWAKRGANLDEGVLTLEIGACATSPRVGLRRPFNLRPALGDTNYAYGRAVGEFMLISLINIKMSAPFFKTK